MRQWPAQGATFLIELYRTYVSPLRPPTCRFTPTCSEYAVSALREWGLLRGLALATWRLLKCGPWYPGGWDPVPQRHGSRTPGTIVGGDLGDNGRRHDRLHPMSGR
ncbi:MAG: membrane protein insertion efficiency factor YidD [Tomitella sp.]|nr:membrane protein insertion efficiency factor YidD [Tomitella sp.]